MKIFFIYFILYYFGFSSDYIVINNSTIQFTGSHVFHDWIGVSSKLESKVSCNEKNTNCSFKFSIPWESFNSRNDNRENNMLYYVNAFDYPNIIMKFENIDLKKLNENGNLITGILTINGISESLSIPLEYKINNKKFKIYSSFNISLEKFNIERPSLLLIPIEILIFINVNITGNFKNAES